MSDLLENITEIHSPIVLVMVFLNNPKRRWLHNVAVGGGKSSVCHVSNLLFDLLSIIVVTLS